ncbi:MAG: T9SS type A sorting domain-containing protein [Bacteroidetes bacterium]|nr:T9SS type A sorting domain-containing protein [Bacteroidota bacterium]
MTSKAMTNRIPAILILLLWILCYPSKAFSQRVVYVDQSASGADNGTSWQNAFVYLQDGLNLAVVGDEVWVATGVYTPDLGSGLLKGDRSARFEIVAGASLYGGFQGNETNIEDRERGKFSTVLSGDLLGNDPSGAIPDRMSVVYQDNSLRVLRLSPGSNQFRTNVDGVTISGATSIALNALGPCTVQDVDIVENVGRSNSINCSLNNIVVARNHVQSPGVLQVSATTIRDSLFEENIASQGGAIQAISEDSVIIARSIFYKNRAADGGAITSTGAHVVLVSSFFIGNVADCAGGAIVMDEGGSLTSVNNVFAHNQSKNSLANCGGIVEGGAIMVYKSRFYDYNSTFAYNKAALNGDVLGLRESIGGVSNGIWNSNNPGNPDVDLISSQFTIRSHLHDEPLMPEIVRIEPLILGDVLFSDVLGTDGFQGTLDDNFQLTSSSPAIDAGNSSLIPRDFADLDGDGNRSEPTPHDALGTPRIQNIGNLAAIDLGAFEFPIPTNVENRPEPKSCFAAYPNPFNSNFNLIVLDSRIAPLKIYNIVGQTMLEISDSFEGKQVNIPTDLWPSGVYLIRSTEHRGCVRLITHY